jgi:hypothetical protein
MLMSVYLPGPSQRTAAELGDLLDPDDDEDDDREGEAADSRDDNLDDGDWGR